MAEVNPSDRVALPARISTRNSVGIVFDDGLQRAKHDEDAAILSDDLLSDAPIERIPTEP